MGMTFWQTFGLVWLLVAAASPVLWLLYDAYRLWVLRIPTLSELVWADIKAWRAGRGKFPWWSAVLVAGVFLSGVVGAAALAIHFYV